MMKRGLVDRASAGTLSPMELQSVADELQSGASDPYEALLVIGRANATQHKDLVEGYLESPADPMLARLALQILCRYWGLTADYVQALERFITKVSWDQDDDVRLMAIDCAGSLLASNRSPRLLCLLYNIFADTSERQIVREAAYCSLALAAGKQPRELPKASRHFDLSNDIDQSVIFAAEIALGLKE